MNVYEVKAKLKIIEAAKGDDETAHGLEDELLFEFITAIKNKKYNNLYNLIDSAEEVLKVKDIDFHRWYA